MASRIATAAGAPVGVARVAFAIVAALVAWLVVAGSAAPSPLAPFFTTVVNPSPSTCPASTGNLHSEFEVAWHWRSTTGFYRIDEERRPKQARWSLQLRRP